MVSAFLAKALLPLMSAKTSHAMDDSPNKNEATAAPNTGPRPTRWVVLRGKLKAVMITYRKASAFLVKALLPLQLSGAVRLPAHCVHRAGASMSAKTAHAMGGSPKQGQRRYGPRYRSQADAMDGGPSNVQDRKAYP